MFQDCRKEGGSSYPWAGGGGKNRRWHEDETAGLAAWRGNAVFVGIRHPWSRYPNGQAPLLLGHGRNVSSFKMSCDAKNPALQALPSATLRFPALDLADRHERRRGGGSWERGGRKDRSLCIQAFSAMTRTRRVTPAIYGNSWRRSRKIPRFSGEGI